MSNLRNSIQIEAIDPETLVTSNPITEVANVGITADLEALQVELIGKLLVPGFVHYRIAQKSYAELPPKRQYRGESALYVHSGIATPDIR